MSTIFLFLFFGVPSLTQQSIPQASRKRLTRIQRRWLYKPSIKVAKTGAQDKQLNEASRNSSQTRAELPTFCMITRVLAAWSRQLDDRRVARPSAWGRRFDRRRNAKGLAVIRHFAFSKEGNRFDVSASIAGLLKLVYCNASQIARKYSVRQGSREIDALEGERAFLASFQRDISRNGLEDCPSLQGSMSTLLSFPPTAFPAFHLEPFPRTSLPSQLEDLTTPEIALSALLLDEVDADSYRRLLRVWRARRDKERTVSDPSRELLDLDWQLTEVSLD